MMQVHYFTLIAAIAVAIPAMADDSAPGEPEAFSAEYIAEMRSKGPHGLETALAEFDQRTMAHAILCASVGNEERTKTKIRFAAMRTAIDQIAAQRDATVSRLYWYTDLAEAKAAAAESGKPILSLHMLGKLTDEYSCANSRFFRTALYSNKEISDYLRNHYVLHWHSVRPVPRVTIDFGDGRTLQRTITGNSAHYVLDAAGRPLDALPGLYGPRAFVDWLRQWEIQAAEFAETAPQLQDEMLAYYHGAYLASLENDLRSDLAKVAPDELKDDFAQLDERSTNDLDASALEASARAVTKSAEVAPILRHIVPGDASLEIEDEEVWRRIAALHRDNVALDEASVGVIRREQPGAAEAGKVAFHKSRVEDPVLRLVRDFEESIALDGVKNEYVLHRKIHRWYVAGEAPRELDALNEKVYAELFLTPSSDPWLGLAPAGVYTALDCRGISPSTSVSVFGTQPSAP